MQGILTERLRRSVLHIYRVSKTFQSQIDAPKEKGFVIWHFLRVAENNIWFERVFKTLYFIVKE